MLYETIISTILKYDSRRAGKITVNATDSVSVNGSDATFNSRKSQFPTEIVNFGAANGQ